MSFGRSYVDCLIQQRKIEYLETYMEQCRNQIRNAMEKSLVEIDRLQFDIYDMIKNKLPQLNGNNEQKTHQQMTMEKLREHLEITCNNLEMKVKAANEQTVRNHLDTISSFVIKLTREEHRRTQALAQDQVAIMREVLATLRKSATKARTHKEE